MAEMSPETGPGQPLTLADEHVSLLRQVTARAEDLLTATADGRWQTDQKGDAGRTGPWSWYWHLNSSNVLVARASCRAWAG